MFRLLEAKTHMQSSNYYVVVLLLLLQQESLAFFTADCGKEQDKQRKVEEERKTGSGN